MRILFVTSTRIGDAVLSTGLLRHLIERYPQARFTIACGAQAAPLFAAMPNAERVIVLVKRTRGGHWFKLWVSTVATYWHLVVDLRASALAYLLATRHRMVLRDRGERVHRVVGLARLAGLTNIPSPRLWTAPKQDARALALVPNGAPLLALGPAANWPGKQWPASRFAELAERLTGPEGILPGARIVLLGGAGERESVKPLLATIPGDRRIDLMGGTDLLTAYAVLKRADFYVGNDSGLMHLAAAAGCPTLGLFGPSREEHYAPWGERTAVVRTERSYDELVGAPDYDYRTKESLMDSLSVDAANAAARELWVRCRADH
ncbi:MAG: glycosyltransferase family 9 protein [Alphaproteobacteria bacterium]|nr:glycosyltransferase family 9 protein [Pseudomonadota bacterium]